MIGQLPLAVKEHKELTWKVLIVGFALMCIIIGSISQNDYNPGKWMTYRDFDVPGEVNFINYLTPGVPDSSSHLTYDFSEKHLVLFFAVLLGFFPFMFFMRVLFSPDFKLGVYRYITQWLTFVVARLGILRVTGICPVKRSGLGVFPFMNCQSCELATGACPLGTFQMSLLNKQIPFILVGQIILVGLISGRWVCGWLCPYGFLSDIFDKIPGKRIKVPLKFTWIKYGFFAVFFLSSIAYFFKDSSDTLLYCSYLCPVGFYYGVLEYALTTGVHSLIEQFPYFHIMLIYHFFVGALIIAGTVKLGGRFFCKFFCPLGMLYGLFSGISIIRLSLNENKCTGCTKCKEVCPMDISILDKRFISRSNCIVCGRCKKVCPEKKIEFTFNLMGKGSEADKKESKRAGGNQKRSAGKVTPIKPREKLKNRAR